ncbi:hypothetical protein HII17_16790 [Thalassotalea sp. M1531]|uniref:PBP domain-containing protein n=1 Tax=Thalassotalea algicola TaxID=2716224 RepID=A0A7Y0Q8S3_9GAMM|nr:substrate-binding domain-containing protein [Thalassotalea algicola]NMP33212.1 hypothetical protein [Thalassotalea algicola]
MKSLYALLLILLVHTPAIANEKENNTLFIVGSTSIGKLVEVTQAPFLAQSGIKLLVRPIGSDKGVVSIAEGVSDLGIVSRYLTPKEVNKWPELSQITFGQDAIVFLANKASELTNLSSTQVVNMYTNQRQGDISLFSKGKRHGTHQSFLDFFELESMPAPLNNNKLVFKKRGINQLYGQVKAKMYNKINQAVANISRTPNSKTFESLGAFKIYSQTGNVDNVKVLSLDGQLPIINDKLNPKYQFKRPLNIIIASRVSVNAQQYINYLLSDSGQSLLKKHYFLPLKLTTD